jgi:phosphatidylinositol kinase/protein kinase (PI-3  family)
MGGKESNMFDYYKCLMNEGFKELRKHVEELSYLLEIMMEESDLPCFTQFKLEVFKERFKENFTDDEVCDILLI